MLTVLIILIAILVLTIFGNLNRLLEWINMKKGIFIGILLFIILLYLTPNIKVGKLFEFNIGGFIGIYVFGFLLLYSQHSKKECLRLLCTCAISVVAFLILDMPGVMLSGFVFVYSLYIKTFVSALPGCFIAKRPGTALAGAVISPVIYDVISGGIELYSGTAPVLGGEYILILSVYSLAAAMIAAGIIFSVRAKRKGKELQFSQRYE